MDDDDELAPVRGLLNGLIVAMVLWCVLLAIVYVWE